jgi:hypothetical protein
MGRMKKSGQETDVDGGIRDEPRGTYREREKGSSEEGSARKSIIREE